MDDADCLRSGSSAWAQRCKTSITRRGLLSAVFEVFVVQPSSPG
jgi:hypothetical protein